MTRKLARHLRGNIVAYVALFFALTAGAYAATNKAPKNSVVSSSIKNGQVKTSDLAANAVKSAKIAPNAVTSDKIAAAAVTTDKLADSSVTGAKIQDGSLTPADLPPFTFTDATLTNGWTPVGSGPTPSFGLDALGFVHLRGTTRAGTLHTSAFTLPVGLRPAQTEPFSTANIFGGNSTPCVVTVNTDGTVVPGVTAADTGCAPAGTVGVSGITFKAGG